MGIIAKKSFTKDSALFAETYYGVSCWSQWYLNGNMSRGVLGEKIKNKIDLKHFESLTDGEIDIYVNDVSGEFKMCMVGNCDEHKEVVIDGINKSGNKDGWVPCISFGSSATSITVRVCEIAPECYGKEIEIEWP